MARITLPVIAIAIAFSTLPGALAGPACTNKQWNSVDECIQKCNNKWGWAGHIMGSDPWGVVVKPASGTDDPKKAVETACKAKFSGSHSTSAASTTKSSTSTSVTPIVNAQSGPPTEPTTSTEKTSTSTTSTSSTASRITTVRTTSTPSTTSTTASTTSSTSRGLATIANTTFSKAEGNTALAEETTKSLPPKSTVSQEPETTSTPPPKTITKAPPPPKTTSTPPPKTTSVDTGDDDDNKGGNNNGNNGGNNNGNSGGGNNGNNNGGGNGGSSNGGSNNGGGSNSGGGSSSGGSVSAADQQRYLNAHNSVRAQHGAGALSWADDLEAAAQKWANNCVFKHSGGTLGPFGENLAAGTGNSYTIETAVKSWTDEVSEFHANNPQPSHFTQVVWKASTEVGCAVADCDGIFDSSFGKAHFHVCEYRSQGNVIGQFAQNVEA